MQSRSHDVNEVRVIGVDVLTDGAGLSKVVLGGFARQTQRNAEAQRELGYPQRKVCGRMRNNHDALAKQPPCLRAKIEYLLKGRVSGGDILLLSVGRFLSLPYL